jgi:arylformamidase
MPNPLVAFDPAKVIDISVTLRKGVPCWPGEDFWEFQPVARMEKGDPCNVSKFAMGCHMGTHVDAPWHFGIGDQTVEAIPMEQLILPARVIDLTHVDKKIARSDLEGKIDGVQAVLFKTKNSGTIDSLKPFDKEFIHPDPSAGEYLVERGIKTLGVDYLSVDGFGVKGAPVHHILLGNGVFIVEGLDLSKVEPRDYLFVVLPLKILGADGAPARAILIDA